ncbi:unnamed protein product [Sphagnum tenellum]
MRLTAIRPRQLLIRADERRADVDDAVGHDHVVVDADDEGEDDHGEADADADGAHRHSWTGEVRLNWPIAVSR